MAKIEISIFSFLALFGFSQYIVAVSQAASRLRNEKQSDSTQGEHGKCVKKGKALTSRLWMGIFVSMSH